MLQGHVTRACYEGGLRVCVTRVHYKDVLTIPTSTRSGTIFSDISRKMLYARSQSPDLPNDKVRGV